MKQGWRRAPSLTKPLSYFLQWVLVLLFWHCSRCLLEEGEAIVCVPLFSTLQLLFELHTPDAAFFILQRFDLLQKGVSESPHRWSLSSEHKCVYQHSAEGSHWSHSGLSACSRAQHLCLGLDVKKQDWSGGISCGGAFSISFSQLLRTSHCNLPTHFNDITILLATKLYWKCRFNTYLSYIFILNNIINK